LWLILLALFLADAVALVIVVVAVGTPPSTFQFELAKGLIQLGLVALVGAALSLLVDQNRTSRERAEKERDRDRQAAEKEADLQRERREYRMELIKATLGRATASYSAVKRSRRLMRALAIIESDGAASKRVMAKPYDAQMIEINNAQLEFENLARDVETSAPLFSDVGAVTRALDGLEKYLNRIITEYEKERRHFTGDPPQLDLDQLPHLAGFLAPRSPDFRAQVLLPLIRVQEALRADLLTEISEEHYERARHLIARIR
jgi:hypothetical protein